MNMQELTQEQFYKGNVARWHAHQSYAMRKCGDNIRDHHFRCVELVCDFVIHPSGNLMLAVAWHDQAEVILGDMPFTAKRDWPALAAAYERAEAEINDKYNVQQPANDYERDVIKFVDRIDAYMTVAKHDPDLLQLDDWVDAKTDLQNRAQALEFDMDLLNLKIKEPK